ncbi:bifunctional adenosylcobinamide kinase/adenosylcobinamide-phosphate guanylyltransferase [bacterium]|nr:bifunctional adenosylcobinamide kinase/adenosylcobinamide-phosphate guanylyltransferase [bacterium]
MTKSRNRENLVTLVTGGSRSGKSTYALKLAENKVNKVFIATAEPLDDEMNERITDHKRERAGQYLTLEEPVKVWEAIRSVSEEIDVIVLDCLTVWLGNLQYHLNDREKEDAAVQKLITVLRNPPCEIVVVTNEVGMGIVPENELSRRFRDAAGWLNQLVAAVAQKVVLVVSGIPVIIKNEREEIGL